MTVGVRIERLVQEQTLATRIGGRVSTLSSRWVRSATTMVSRAPKAVNLTASKPSPGNQNRRLS
jgi:hypothetical protein